MNKELLFDLYRIHSRSGAEKRMRRFVRRYISNNCGDDITMVTDKAGNLLVTKGTSDTYPCLASHLDQVQDAHSRDFKVYEQNGVVFAFSAKSREQQGLGADDKNGIFVCLECLRMFDILKVAFFVEEEIGCGGSEAVDLSFFADCRFIIEPDRRGGSDLITSMSVGDVCSKDFVDAIRAEHYGYKKATGTITDVGTLVERGVGISCLNVSCGYYNAHTDSEVTVLDELENCLHFVASIVNTCTDVYPFEYVDRWAGYRGCNGLTYKGGSYHDGWYDDDGIYSPSSALGEPLNRYGLTYSEYDYNEDYDLMLMLFESDRNIDFDDVLRDFRSEFRTNDADMLRSIYDDIYEFYHDDICEDDEDAAGELSFDVTPVKSLAS